ncbi:MAG: DNA translocase FtsK [Patescibacteria group bacterium]
MKKSKRKRESKNSDEVKFIPVSKIGTETKKSVAAVLLLGLAILLILASIDKAGPVGTLTFHGFTKLFGIGYYLLPGVSLILALLFFFTRERRFMGTTLGAAAGTILTSLGLIDVLFPGNGGFIGTAIGSLEGAFGKTATIVLTTTLIVTLLLIAGNASLRFRKRENETYVHEEDAETPIAVAEVEVEEETTEAPEEIEVPSSSQKRELEAEPVVAEAATLAPALKTAIAKAKDYVAPPLSLLKSSTEKPTSGDLRANANIIKRTLESFGIAVDMGEINIGPKVTRYTLKPAEGVKLMKITALSPDLSLALAAHPIRIEAPIPGKSLVGIEVPNKAAAIVRLGNLMGYQEFSNGGPLMIPLGRDVSGEPIFSDIERMPHLLVAGATGSGKSITIHSILSALLFKNGPATLKLILIDPKRVELSIYEGIPHLIAPVITEGRKSVAVFRWAIGEMERRYEMLLQARVRDIKNYNKSSNEPMPYIVIVVDEMADLMASYGKEIEGSIVRLAQMARATGIHLIVSTQRPSVEVITGLIKANITTRIALQVASQIDSRTILDAAGAEKLLGGGDLLFVSSEFSKPKRIQGAYLTEEEIHKVTDFIKENNEVVTIAGASSSPGVVDTLTGPGNGISLDGGDEEDDELYEEAVQAVRDAKKASASLLQRRLKVGYARAARLLDIMEAKGIIGPGEGAKPRAILIEEDEGAV